MRWHWSLSLKSDRRLQLPEVPPNPSLRAQLETESTEKLFQKLKQLDPQRAKTIDPHNKRRLIRALEILQNQKRNTFFKEKSLHPGIS